MTDDSSFPAVSLDAINAGTDRLIADVTDRDAWTFEGIDLRVSREGRVFWASDWARIDELVDAGYLFRTFYGPATYGHCDYFVAVDIDRRA